MASKIVRVYTRENGVLISDTTLKYNQPFEIVVEVEASDQDFNGGVQFAAGLIVRDLSDNTILAVIPQPGTPAIATNDNMNGANWDRQADEFVYRVNPLGPGKENHICKVQAFLRVGVANPDVTFAEGDLFIITR